MTVVTSTGELSLENMPDAPDAEWLRTLLQDYNNLKRQVVAASKDLTRKDNTFFPEKTINLVHGVELEIAVPAPFDGTTDRVLKNVVAQEVVGLTLDSTGKPTASTYALGLAEPLSWRRSTNAGKVFVRADYALEHTKPFARFRKSANQSHNVSGTNIPVTWDVTQEADPAGVISVTSNPSGPTLTRVTVREAGKYLVTSTLAFDVNATGARAGQLSPNGATGAGSRMSMWFSVANAADIIQGTNAHVFKLAAGGYVELFGYQTSGGALNMLGNGTNECSLSIERLRNDTTPTARINLVFVGE